MEGVHGGISWSSATTNSDGQSEEYCNLEMDQQSLRRGPWTVEEDLLLMNYIASHGEGRWNLLAQAAGLKRTGKSCRLRWLNYLRPDVRRGNITLEEQLKILELHSRWGNRWSKIAQHLPGRTDNEIKNYWRTRVQKHAKQLRCDVNSKLFKDTMRYNWIPRLVERIQAANSSRTTTTTVTAGQNFGAGESQPPSSGSVSQSYTPENSITARSSSDSLGTQFSTECYSFQADQIGHVTYQECLTSPLGYDYHGLGFQGVQQSNMWLGSEVEEIWENLWSD